MAGLLAGTRVLDLTNVLAGPFCCYQLTLIGAEVIKVEVPGAGDLARQRGADPELNRRQMGASFLAQNAGKRSVTLNLKSPKGGMDFAKQDLGSGRRDAEQCCRGEGVQDRAAVHGAMLARRTHIAGPLPAGNLGIDPPTGQFGPMLTRNIDLRRWRGPNEVTAACADGA